MIRYLNLTEFADRIGIARDTLAKYRLPDPDALIGDRRGWLESTIDLWNESRPGRGNWGPKDPVAQASSQNREEPTLFSG
jgi:predicted DNA-binding transcriptional regulator AlpA